MNISGICNVYFPDRLLRVKAAYDGSDLQSFLDQHVEWRGIPVTAAEIQSKIAEHQAAILAATNAATSEALASKDALAEAARGVILFALFKAIDGDMTNFNQVKNKLQTVSTNRGVTIKKLFDLIF